MDTLTKRQNIVIVTGHTGSGKSAILHHIALKYRNEGCNVKPVRTVMDMIQIINSSKSILNDEIIFVLDDPIGKESFDEIEYTSWRKYEESLQACLNKIKLLVSCRKYILSDVKVKGILKDKSNVIDLTKDQFKLSIEEKKDIWKKHGGDETVFIEELSENVQTESCFPLLCRLYLSKKFTTTETLRFFKAPVEVFEEELRNFRQSSKYKYCALVLIVLFNNNLCIVDLRKSKEKYKLALELCGMKKTTAPYTICDALNTLEGFFVKKIGNIFNFYHDFVLEVTTYVFAKDYLSEIIECVDIGFLRKKVKLKCCNDNSDLLTIHLSDEHIDALGKRLFNEIFGEHLLDVVLNNCLKNEKVIQIFINELKRHPEKIKMLLEKKSFQIDCQEMIPTSNNLFLSKLVFVLLEEMVSPLSAIIIFCDTELSFYCLQTLLQMSPYFVDNSLFSSVCCSGSKDLFALFKIGQNDECLKEKWNFLYPIHIASAFNNKEILLELIQNGADVNQKTTNENYWTPLILAFDTDTDENEENDIKQSHQSRRQDTVQLLLSNKADINLCMKDGASPLLIASKKGHDNIVQLLLQNGADINFSKEDGASPLYVACREGHENIVQILLSNGADINVCMEDGTSPLHVACREGHFVIVELLIKKGAGINDCTKNGASPIFVACQVGRENIVKLLLSNEADIYLCKNDGTGPLHVACREGHNRIAELLLKKGAEINNCTKDGASPLVIACEHEHFYTVQLLLNSGADINLCTKNGVSPLHAVCKHTNDDIARLLLDFV